MIRTHDNHTFRASVFLETYDHLPVFLGMQVADISRLARVILDVE